MSDVGPLQGPMGAGRIQSVSAYQKQAVSNTDRPFEEGDTVEISTKAEMLAKIRDLPEIRIEKVAPIRSAILNGTYDVDGKLDEALDRLLEDL